MGKIFVKGPVESPDDLLAKESRLGQAGRIGLDATQGAINLTRPGAIQSAADLAGVPLSVMRYFMEGKHKRQLTDEEKDEMRFRAQQKIRDKLEAERRPMMQEQKRIADNQALLGRFQNLAQRTGADVIGLDAYRDTQDLAGFQEFANMNYPGMSMNEVADMLGRQFTNVESQSLRNILSGKPAIEGYTPDDRANQMIAVSNAAAPNVGGGDLAPLPPDIQNTINRNIANQQIEQMATVPETQTQISPADNAASVAASGGVNSSPHSAKEEDKRDDAMATNSENMDYDNETGVERPKQEEPEPEPEVPFTLGGPGNAPVSPQSMSPGTVPPGPNALRQLDEYGR
tara:strand:+ start:9315 stop:10346 length:1032 start_codon:yes stop_codon:yes gene_type:complete